MNATDPQRVAWAAATATLRRHVRVGDVLTHLRCMGALEEHIFTGWDGVWLCGKATPDTKRYSRFAEKHVTDIAASNVTHLNRNAVASLDFLAEINALGLRRLPPAPVAETPTGRFSAASPNPSAGPKKGTYP